MTPLTGKTKMGLILVLFWVLSSLQSVWAATGSIHTDQKWAWSENAGWVNFRPWHGGIALHGSGAQAYLTGYAWTENTGWIKLGSDGIGPYGNTTSGDWGVNADGDGKLSGYAWSENAGWINFNPTHSQVTFDVVSGAFDGYAWAENVGWIHFKNTAPDYNVLTPRLSIADVGVAENSGPAGFSVTLSQATGVDVVLDYTTADETALAGSDYAAVSGSAVITLGETTTLVAVPLINDVEVNEGNETFTLHLSAAEGASMADQTATGTILDDDIDTDGDGMPDWWEDAYGLDSGSDDAGLDPDGDGLNNLAEYQAQTSPGDPDSDVDQMPDGWEHDNGLDPRVNDAAGDADGDGFTNLEEYTFNSNPQHGGSTPPGPIADAGPDHKVAAGSLVTLNGANSTDSDGVIDTYLWEQTGGFPVILVNPSAAFPTFTTSLDATWALTFRLTVTDDDGLSGTDSCIVNVVNGFFEPPAARSGAAQTVSEGAAVTLDGTGSTDSDGTIDTYLWVQTAGSTVTLSDPAAATPSFTAPSIGTQVLSFLLTVTDNDGLKGTDVCIVNVTDEVNDAPAADAGPDQEITEGGTVTLNGANSTDPQDNQATAFLWTQTSGLPVTLSDTTAAGPTFVTPPAGAGGTVLHFRCTVTDAGGLKDGDGVAVTVSDNGISGCPLDTIPFTAATGEEICIRAASGGDLVNLDILDPDTIAHTADKPENQIYGLIDIQIKVPAPGDTAMVTFYLPVPDGYRWYKYSPVNGWSDFTDNVTFLTGVDQVRLTLTDGGAGDDDGVANGIIVDPSGPGTPPPFSVSSVVVSSGGGGGGCFIATAAFGSHLEPGVEILRKFRDRFLLKNSVGRTFVRLYYTYSPPLADFIAERHHLRRWVRLILLPLVGLSWAVLEIGPVASTVLILLLAFSVIGIVRFNKTKRSQRKPL